MQKLSQKTQGIVYVLIAAFGFSLMSMFIKLAGDLPSFEKAFFRNFVALIFITILMLRSRTSFRPERRNLPALAGVLGGLGAGAAYTFVRYLGARGENGSRIVFYFSAFSCIVCVPFVALDYAPMSLLQLVYLLLAGAFACVGQLGITKAYVCAPAREISVYDYTQVLFAAALGFFVFGDVPDWLSVLGYVLICGAGVGMFLYNRRHDAAHP